jgi:putative endonuclease
MMSEQPHQTKRHQLGDFGEDIAATHLLHIGYTLVARKWRCVAGEVDLIALYQGELVFVEVRTRRGCLYGSGEESVTQTKQKRLISIAHIYLAMHYPNEYPDWRIDVIAIDVTASGSVSRLHHIPSAVEQQL